MLTLINFHLTFRFSVSLGWMLHFRPAFICPQTHRHTHTHTLAIYLQFKFFLRFLDVSFFDFFDGKQQQFRTIADFHMIFLYDSLAHCVSQPAALRIHNHTDTNLIHSYVRLFMPFDAALSFCLLFSLIDFHMILPAVHSPFFAFALITASVTRNSLRRNVLRHSSSVRTCSHFL